MRNLSVVRHACVVLLLSAIGCSNANVALSPASALPGERAKNHTRAAVFADVSLPREAAPSRVQSDRTVGPHDGRQSAPDQFAAMPRDKNEVFVGLALSGGGSRSANFGAACMFQLQRTGLLQHVDYISSVSGGSVAAAYYCTSGAEWNPAAAQQKLTQGFASALICRTFLPWNLTAFFFSDWDHSDVLAGVFRDTLFNRNGRDLTYADLRPDRPRLLINSTDLQSGRRFVFCNEAFDELNSDLSRYPISYAVTASAAVPVILHPVTLRDYSTTFLQYRHLVDGGVADNLGIQTLVETYAAQIESARRAGRPDPYPRGAVFIIVDAHTDFNAMLSAESDVGIFTSLKAAAGLTGSALLNKVSSATLAETIVSYSPDEQKVKELRAELKQLNDDGFVRLTDRGGHAVRVLYLSLNKVNGLPNLPFGSFSESVNSISTYFNIAPTEAYELYQAAEILMKQKFEEKVRGIVDEIEGRAAPATQPATKPANS
ncbi:MAG: Patatin [Phycisphaerales bacterium]|nr:Patatin [Phycisphaerales bacterium]